MRHRETNEEQNSGKYSWPNDTYILMAIKKWLKNKKAKRQSKEVKDLPQKKDSYLANTQPIFHHFWAYFRYIFFPIYHRINEMGGKTLIKGQNNKENLS